MSVKVIFAHATNPLWVKVAANLTDIYSWEICYLVGTSITKQDIKKRFPKAVFHLKADAKRGLIPPECSQLELAPLDEKILNSLSTHESIALKMMDRLNIDGTYTYQKRVRLYHFNLMYWQAVLNHFKPDFVLFGTTSHMVYDYLLYLLCGALGIRTIMFDRTSLPGHIYPLERFEEGSKSITTLYTEKLKGFNGRKVQLSSNAEEHIIKLQQDYSKARPFHLEYKLRKLKEQGRSLPESLKKNLKFMKDTFAGILSIIKGYPDFSFNNRFHLTIGEIKRNRLALHYDKLTETIDLNKPYIFVALQCEPERQTSPSGGVFSNQFLMIDLLSKTIPEGWNLYVKEHVSQFKPYHRAELSKTYDFYDDTASLPNVKIVPLSVTSFDLIDNAMAVATVSGTVGWEAVIRGTPALLFGHAWYRGCEGVFHTPTKENCTEAINKISSGYEVDHSKVRLFLHVIDQISFRGHIDIIYEKISGVDNEQNASKLAKIIYKFYSTLLANKDKIFLAQKHLEEK
jgi:hypothetical protein